ncbi:30S ribosomal protein S16 [Candidatus Gottesmanbacteria bacterium]|nr:30S ribosomal protein S16 [Candidatus Gottesmanbacteria bacterium]
MLKIRLSQTGTTNRKAYKIIAIEEGKRREGKPVEVLGTYNPLVKPPVLTLNRERVSYWKSMGAQVSPGAQKLLS